MLRSLDTIVCGVDDSPPSCHAAQTAVHLARAAGARLVLVHVTGVGPSQTPVTPGGVSMTPSTLVRETLATGRQVQDHARRWLSDLAEQIGAGDAEQLVAPFGDPVRRLGDVADEREAGLLVVGSNGRSAVRDVLLGSVSGRLAADTVAPVLIVPPCVQGSLIPSEWAGRRIVSGFDGSENASRAARFAAALAARVGADLHIAYVVDGASEPPPGGEPADAALQSAARAESRVARGGLAITREQRRGDPADQLERVAAAATAPALVLGIRGRAPWRAVLLGSVSRRVLDVARRPVILVSPSEIAPTGDGQR